MNRFYKLLFAGVLVAGATGVSNVEAQAVSPSKQYVNISFQEDGKNKNERKYLKGLEVQAFDMSAYIEENHQKGSIYINGSILADGVMKKIKFQSKPSDFEGNIEQFCQVVSNTKEVPFLGVAMGQTDEHIGVNVNDVVASTSAEGAGLIEGDIITAFEANDIYTPCDLTSSINQYEPGEMVMVEFVRNGKWLHEKVVLGSRKVETLSFKACDQIKENIALPEAEVVQPTIASLSVFPNPTHGPTQVQFQAYETANLEWTLTDISGRIIRQGAEKDFKGQFSSNLDFTKETNGIYFLRVVHGEETFIKKIVVQHAS